jgi:hypothetical protein
MHCRERIPFSTFPGIFSAIDSLSKRITAGHFARHGKLPAWFSPFGELGVPIPVPHWSKFQITHPESNIILTGAPDEITRKADQTLFIGDYKTARLTDWQDELFPLYETQLNVYAYIAVRVGLGMVTSLGLLYYEPIAAITTADIDTLVDTEGFRMRFAPKVLPVELKPQIVPPLLFKVREIYNLPAPPIGIDGCKDCGRLNRLIELINTETMKV